MNFKFAIIIDDDLGQFDLKATRIDMYDINRIMYNMDQTKVGIDVYGIFNRIAFVIDNFVEISPLTLFLQLYLMELIWIQIN